MVNAVSNKLTAGNSLVMLIDHQPGLLMSVKSMEPLTLKNNLLAFSHAIKVVNVPVILTFQGLGGFGPILPDLVKIFPENKPVDRTIINAWEDPAIRKQIEASGKKNIILAGVSVEVCLAFPALSIQDAGYQVYAVMDLSGTWSKDIAEWAFTRMVQKGIIPVNFTAVLMEMLGDNARPEAAGIYGALSASWAVPNFIAEYSK